MSRYGGQPNPFDQRGGGGGGGYGQSYNNNQSGGYGQSYNQQGSFSSQGGGYGGGGSQYGSPAAGSYNSPAPSRPPVGQFGQSPRPGASPNAYASPSMGRDDYGSNNVEMASLAQNASSFAQQDPNYIINECERISGRISQLTGNTLAQLRVLMDRSINEAARDETSILMDIDRLSKQIMDEYRELTQQVRKIKSKKPEADLPKNSGQVNRVDRAIKAAILDFQQLERDYRQRSNEKMGRQYKIANPNATQAEINDFINRSPEEQDGVFQQALLNSRIQGGQTVLGNVRSRREQFEEIEKQVIELAQLFEQLDQLIVQQDVQVREIERKGEEVVENLDKGNNEIAIATDTAKKTRKKKWICLGIVVAIVVIVAAIVAIYFTVINKPVTNKRWLEAPGLAPLERRYFLAPNELPPVSQPIADFIEVARSGADVGGKFTLDSLAAGSKAKRVVLPGGRALHLLNGVAVRGREAAAQ